jgi:hypothetical protein
MTNISSFDRVLQQIDHFIRKYYKNELIKGLLFFVGLFLITYLTVITLEFFGHFNSFLRATLFFSFILVNGYVIGRYFVLPLLKLKSYGKRIDRYQASVIIGRFFPSVSDRLLNTLQLRDELNSNSADLELLAASIQQRAESMSTIPFSDAIDLKENNRYLFWVLPIVLFTAFVFWLSPGLFTQGTKRVVNFTKDYPIIAPYEYELKGLGKSVEEGSDVELVVELSGDQLPDQVYVHTRKGKFLMNRKQKNLFSFELPQVRSSQVVKFSSVYRGFDIFSEEYELEVIGKTAVGKLDAILVYPSYLGMDNEVLNNATDVVVPEGTRIEWSVLTKNSEGTKWKWSNGKSDSFKNEGFRQRLVAKEDMSAVLLLRNKFSKKLDSVSLSVSVVKDAYPSIQVEEMKDSLKDGVRFFSGFVNDDHGLQSLKFHYTIYRKNGTKLEKLLPVVPVSGLEQRFNYAVDFRREEVQLEDRIEYRFTVGDNDGVNGSKYSSSTVFTYKLPTLDELVEKRNEDQTEINKQLKALQEQADKFREDLERLKRESMNSNSTSWKQKNQAEQLKEQHESILEKLNDTKEMMNNSIEEKDQLSEMDEELMKKQEMINDLLEELMDEELRELLDKLEDLLKNQDKNELEKAFDELEMNSDEMKNQLDRSLEMLKKLQVDEKIDDIEKQLKELAVEQKALAEEVKSDKKSTEDALKEQEKLNKEFDKLKEEIGALDSLNQELQRPMELGDLDQRPEDIQKELNEAKENLSKGKSGKASEGQKGAGEKMEQLAEDLDQAQQESNQQQQEEDISMLRQILESLLILSDDQESLMKRMAILRDDDPAFVKSGKSQRKLITDTGVVSDSLNELAKRQPKIARFIDEELAQIFTNQGLAIEDIDERRRRELEIHQQYAMTSYNNLALMLNESLQQMQQQMQQMKPGSGSCNKPGGKGMPKPGEGMMPGNMKDMLKKQLEQMQKGQQEGSKPGEGKKPGEGQGGMMGNQGLAKMAAEQGAIRRRLEELRKELNKDGSGGGNKLNPLINELEKQENDIINKRINEQVVKRQKEILTRLLESEKAIMERGWDEKRESKEGKSENNSNLIEFREYTKERLKQIELLRSVDPTYRKYYKDRANEYLNRVL